MSCGGGVVTTSLWTRTRKRILSMPHIQHELISVAFALRLPVGVYHIDGELYNHAYRDRFEQLTSLIRPDEPRPGHDVVEYHVYDIVSSQPFLDRFRALEHAFVDAKHIRLVETHVAADAAQLMGHYDYFRKAGYEGAMARQLHLPYEHKRSDQLLKLKNFVDAEFKIVALEEGRGKLRGHVGAFVCEMPLAADAAPGTAPLRFAAKMAGDTAALATAWQQPDKWIGKMLTVKFQGRTAQGIPRFPVGLRLRDEATT